MRSRLHAVALFSLAVNLLDPVRPHAVAHVYEQRPQSHAKSSTLSTLFRAGLRILAVEPVHGYDAKKAIPCLGDEPEVRATTTSFGLLRLVPTAHLGNYVDATISCEDNLRFMRRLADETMNLIVTSPPYNLGKEYEEKRSQERYIEEQVACIAEAVRLLHPTGSICWQVGNHVKNGEVFPLDILLYPIFKSAGLQLRNRIVWTFGHGLHCQKRFSGRHETILWFTKTENYTFNLDPVRVPSKYPEKKHFKGSKKEGGISGNPFATNPSEIRRVA